MNLIEYKNGKLSISYQRNVSDSIDVANTIKWHSPSASIVVGGSSYTKLGQRDMLIGKYVRGTSANNSIPVNKLKLYPNPSEEFLVIEPSISGELKVYTLAGQIVHTQNLESNTISYSVDVSNWLSGLYLVEISNGKEIQSSLIIKK
jgi:hypothetical protein